MRRIAFVLCLGTMMIAVVPAQRAHATSCSRVAGGSQTSNWYTNGNFESLVVNAEWERQSRGGQSISRWGIGGSGWATRVWSPCSPATSPDRLVLQVLPDHGATQESTTASVAAAVAAVPVQLPSVTRVTLIPPVGGDCPGVGLVDSQLLAINAINANVGGIVDAGPIVNVPDCSMFSDNSGHLTSEGAAYAAGQYAALL